jgi:hypothetical protein
MTHFIPNIALTRGGGHTMLTRPGLGNDPRFAHALGQQDLSHGVVDSCERRCAAGLLVLDQSLVRPVPGEAFGEIQGVDAPQNSRR